MERMKELIRILNEASDAYYNKNNPIMTDYEFDCLYDELVRLESETGITMANSPTQNVGFEVKSELIKVTHSHPMLSLGKTKSVGDLVKFSKDKDCILSLKMDGLTVLLTYDNGVLTKAETRGNGEVGEDITHNAKVFENIPLTISDKGHCEFEGEAIITYDDFEKINSELPDEDKYKNPRNLVSGSVRQLDSSIAAKRHIKFVLWKVPYIKNTSMLDALGYASELGFTIVPFELTNWSDLLDDYEKYIYYLKERAKEEGYPIDGMVMTYDDIDYGLSLGLTGHHPRHSIAYKFYDEEVETTLTDIEWTMGKTGVLTPTAVFEDVEIDGTTVNRASVHNVSILTQLNLHPGDKITVYKANMIIPQIAENLSHNDDYVHIPGVCPICGGKAEIKQDNDSKILVCTNPNCKGKLLGKLSHAVSRNALNIDGLSEATLEKFIKLGWVSSIKDIYDLKNYEKNIAMLEGFGKKSCDKLLDSIEESRYTTLDRFIYSLSIPLIGRTASKAISKLCKGNPEKFLTIKQDQLRSIEGFGDKMIESLFEVLHDDGSFDDICNLMDEFEFKIPEERKQNVDLTGKTFVITGKLTTCKRDELVQKIADNGGKVSGSVTSKTSYLANNDLNSTSSKNKKAKELGVPIINEHEILKMLGEV